MEPIDVACQLHERAERCPARGDYRGMLRLAKQALAAMRRAVGEKHPDFANVLSTLGGAYEGLGRYSAAANAYRRAFRIMQRFRGDGPIAQLKLQTAQQLAGIYR